MPDPADTRQLGRVSLRVSLLGFGSGPLGGLIKATDDAAARDALKAAHDAGLRYVDTAPLYGSGLAERRVGDALIDLGRKDFVISTKVGRILKPRRDDPATPAPTTFHGALPFNVEFDYGYDGVMRSFEDSLQRLGTDRVDILLVHDINRKYQGDRIHDRVKEVMTGGHRALEELRSQKVIGAFGAGINDLEVCTMLMREGDFDCFMVPGRYTLLNRDAAKEFLPECHRRNIGVLLAAPYESGILATGAVPGAMFNYVPATPEVLQRVRKIQDVCDAHGVTLAAAALQFPLRQPMIASVVVGMRSRAEVLQNAAWMKEKIDEAFWNELELDLTRD